MTGSEVSEGSGADQGEDNGNKRAADERPQKDRWDKAAILARPVAAVFAALTVALIGWLGQIYLSDQAAELSKQLAKQEEELSNQLAKKEDERTIRLFNQDKQRTIRSENEQNFRLYTELMTRREEAESALRKDMFEAILTQFFQDTRPDGGAADTSKRLLKLEMLALNFSESLSLSPLFLELDNDIETLGERPGQSAYWRLERDQYRARLRSLARRVSARQLSALSIGGTLFEFEVPIDKAATEDGYRWPDHLVEEKWRDPEVVHEELLQELLPHHLYGNRWDNEEEKNALIAQLIEQEKRDVSRQQLDGTTRDYTAWFTNVNTERKTLDVALEIQDVPEEAGSLEKVDARKWRPYEMSFQLNFFNFPMIDNTRLSKDQRFALVMESFSTVSIKIAGVYFPGTYSSQRDKPTLNEIIDQLRRSNNANSKGEKPGP